ncbi:MAG TPA: hypothetical protein VH600_17000 [Burkholderiales bacterium]|jgi:cytoskeletal protein RodZ
MADELDPKVSQRYRELPAEEPPRELDQAILAAAHRAADHAHAPLVAPAGRHRWYFAFGAVAILVLAVAITVQLDRTQLDSEALTAASAPPASEERKETMSDSKAQPREDARANLQEQPVPSKPPSRPARDAVLKRQEPQPPSLAAPATPAPSQANSRDQSSGAAAGMFSMQEQARKSREAAPAAAPSPEAGRAVASASIAPPLGPEQLLERIAELRRQGKQEEADKALAEFRQRYPGYQISDEMLKKVERPK